jgi:hypothetical protein
MPAHKKNTVGLPMVSQLHIHHKKKMGPCSYRMPFLNFLSFVRFFVRFLDCRLLFDLCQDFSWAHLRKSFILC